MKESEVALWNVNAVGSLLCSSRQLATSRCLSFPWMTCCMCCSSNKMHKSGRYLFDGVQATIQGFVSRGFSEEKAESLLSRSVRLVVEARDQFWEQHQSQLGKQAVPPIQPGTQPGNHFAGGMKLHGGRGARHKPLVAASVGSYGAYLADGSEYRYCATTVLSCCGETC